MKRMMFYPFANARDYTELKAEATEVRVLMKLRRASTERGDVESIVSNVKVQEPTKFIIQASTRISTSCLPGTAGYGRICAGASTVIWSSRTLTAKTTVERDAARPRLTCSSLSTP